MVEAEWQQAQGYYTLKLSDIAQVVPSGELYSLKCLWIKKEDRLTRNELCLFKELGKKR